MLALWARSSRCQQLNPRTRREFLKVLSSANMSVQRSIEEKIRAELRPTHLSVSLLSCKLLMKDTHIFQKGDKRIQQA